MRLSILVICLGLMVGSFACDGNLPGFTPSYGIRISSTVGGAVTKPGEGYFRYRQGTVVELVAQPDRGYEFVHWVTNAPVADLTDPTTTVVVNYHCFVIAQFREI